MDDCRVLRGDRLVAQLLTEASSVPTLQSNIEQAFPATKKRQYITNTVVVSNIEYIPYIGMKMLHVKSIAASNGHQYNQVIQFLKVQFESEDTNDNVTFHTNDGSDYHVLPLILSGHNVKIKCSCLDFFYRFAPYNHQDTSLVGKPPPIYIRKTDNRPSVNPSKTPGACKHILRLVKQLQMYGLVQS